MKVCGLDLLHKSGECFINLTAAFMTGRNPEFTDGFRREAVRLSIESGKTIPEIAADLGMASRR